jgi:hypothetical protein
MAPVHLANRCVQPLGQGSSKQGQEGVCKYQCQLTPRCSKCGRAQQGFRQDEMSVPKAIDLLAERNHALVGILGRPTERAVGG